MQEFLLANFCRKFSTEITEWTNFNHELDIHTCGALGSNRTLKHVCAEFGW